MNLCKPNYGCLICTTVISETGYCQIEVPVPVGLGMSLNLARKEWRWYETSFTWDLCEAINNLTYSSPSEHGQTMDTTSTANGSVCYNSQHGIAGRTPVPHHEEELEQTPLVRAVTTYLCYMVLTFWGYIADFMRRIGLKSDGAISIIKDVRLTVFVR